MKTEVFSEFWDGEIKAFCGSDDAPAVFVKEVADWREALAWFEQIAAQSKENASGF